ncbi:hypothetical protein O181_113499 [Austropuccinia psidii MF-1]|uniref:Uncharacterized protein n=1 Tax=Austropuccinia psidii MF-1 TaxID=1389203 RepID=A0A9Q3PTQ8_9BASI|nr:hypothetical protein [Austropuccinia psidii MF-1]
MSPGQISHQLTEIDFTTHSDNINHHMCHYRMSLKAQPQLHTLCNVRVITRHGATQQFGMLTLVHEKTSTPPPHLLLGLKSLCCCGDLKLCLRHRPHLPNMPPTLLTILTLAVPSRHASDTPYHPYAYIVTARHSSNAAYHPYTCSALPTCL